ncbi:MAG: peptidyl-prolyl cis-trans isomerase [bacterium]
MILRKNKIIFCIFIISSVFLLFYCDSKLPHDTIIAKVNKTILTLPELKNRIPREYSKYVSREQNIQYVKRWIDNEVLYQQALKQGLHKQEEIKNRLKRIEKDLLIAEIMSRSTYRIQDIKDDEIETYYKNNIKQFLLTQDEVKFCHIRIKSNPWEIRNQIKHKDPLEVFLRLARKHSLDTIGNIENIPFLPKDQLTPEIAGAVFPLIVDGTTPPVKTSSGFLIIRVLDKRSCGSPLPLSDVKEEISNILSSQYQKKVLEEYIARIKKNQDIELNIHLIPDTDKGIDSTKQE